MGQDFQNQNDPEINFKQLTVVKKAVLCLFSFSR